MRFYFRFFIILTKGVYAMDNKKIADKDEVLEYLTGIMRDDDTNEKDRLTASKQLGKYLGLEVNRVELSGEAKVAIYDDIGSG